MPADLHIHSNFSDGSNIPEQIVESAAAAGLTSIALTDHDITDGVERARQKGLELGIEVIPGIEFTTENSQCEIHILGYFIDYREPEFASVLAKIQKSRVDRIYRIVKKLNALKVEIEAEEVFALSGKKAPGRPHVARALVNSGQVSNFKEAFNRYLDFRSPAYVPHYKLTPAQAIQLISSAGGIPVFAHPLISQCDKIIPELVAQGLRGIEVYYPGYFPETIKHYTDLARGNKLLITGGSDFHGPESGRDVKLGDIKLPDEFFEELKNEHLCRNKP